MMKFTTQIKFTPVSLFILLASCSNEVKKPGEVNNIKIGIIERLDPALDNIIDSSAQAEIISEGYVWSEGPLWIESQKMLLFSDVPANTIYKWTEENRKEIYLTPSGYTGTLQRGGETGSNGLTLNNDGKLILCQHGDRRIAVMDAPLDKPEAKFTTIAGDYAGKKFNSPNDAVCNDKGEIFFTDPPYGLESQMNDPGKEINFQGVYRVKNDGTVQLITDSLTRPNGIAFLPGYKTLLIANSDPDKPNWYAYDLNDNDEFVNGRIFLASTSRPGERGLPDGLKVDKNGTVFASGPGGVWIFNKDAKLLGRIKLPDSVSNCALTEDEKTLFITNDMYVLRIVLRK